MVVDDFGEYPMDIIRRKKKNVVWVFFPLKTVGGLWFISLCARSRKKMCKPIRTGCFHKNPKRQEKRDNYRRQSSDQRQRGGDNGHNGHGLPHVVYLGAFNATGLMETYIIHHTDRHSQTHAHKRSYSRNPFALEYIYYKVFFDSPVDN